MRELDIAIAWSGMPPYAATNVSCLLKDYKGSVAILGTRADVPHRNLEELAGADIVWLSQEKVYNWDDLDLGIPKVMIHTGWAYPCFNSLGKKVTQAGGYRISMIDTIWYGTFRQYVGLIVFRLVYRKWFASVIVPGKEGRKFCKLMGMPRQEIYEGLYGASPKIFIPGPPLIDRPKRILFVGRLIERKGIMELISAVREFKKTNTDWEFVLVGKGELEGKVDASGLFTIREFSTPTEVSELMQSSRILVLPSREENWGVVVHEATLSGCGLILSDKVGARSDLLTEKNGFLVRSSSCDDLLNALTSLSNWDSRKYDDCFAASLSLARQFGPKVFSKSILSILSKYT